MDFEAEWHKYPWRRTLEVYDSLLNDFISADYAEIYKHYPYSGGMYACSIFEHTSKDKEKIKLEWDGHNKITITLGDTNAGLE